jgi:hypothetical protein
MSDDTITRVAAEPVTPVQADKLAHLATHRGLIVRRSLLVGAIRGFLPVPVLDEHLAVRVRAGLLTKLASGRQVDLPPASASVLATEGGAAKGLTLAAAAALVAKFAGRKFLAVLAAGRGADEMARSFYRATLFDHYCARLHVGGPISVADAERLRNAIDAELRASAGGPAVGAFRDGGRVLGRSLLEAPRWVSQRITKLAERFVRTGGNPDILDAVPEPEAGEDTWLERASQTVEDALARAGNAYLGRIVEGFERAWQSGPVSENTPAD